MNSSELTQRQIYLDSGYAALKNELAVKIKAIGKRNETKTLKWLLQQFYPSKLLQQVLSERKR